jgi:hypothetical protein
MLGQSVVEDAWLGNWITDRMEDYRESSLELAVYRAGMVLTCSIQTSVTAQTHGNGRRRRITVDEKTIEGCCKSNRRMDLPL